MKKGALWLLLALSVALAPGLPTAQPVAAPGLVPAGADPMRPLLAAAGPAGAASAAGSAALQSGASSPAVRKLLAIRQDNSGERSALLGDRWLRSGDRYAAPQGEVLVVAVGSNHIELEQDKVRSTHHLLVPLLPPQWPTLPAAKPAPPPAPVLTTPPATPTTASATSAARSERPSSP